MSVLRMDGAAIDDLTLTRYAQQVEHEYLGVKCGLLDQIGSLMARPGQVMLTDFQSLRSHPSTSRSTRCRGWCSTAGCVESLHPVRTRTACASVQTVWRR